MLILALDTSGREGSLALARAEAETCTLIEQVSLAGGTYSARVIPELAGLLERNSLQRQAIDLYVVASGPGSFTGLRVGLATVKALAEVLGRLLVEVSVLEALAFANGRKGRVITALDAQRGEVFIGEFEVAGAETAGYPVATLRQELAPLGDFAAWAFAHKPKQPVVTSDAAVADALRRAGVDVALASRPTAGTMARMGLLKFRAGITVAPAELDANYIRRSDAEIFSAPRLGIPKS